MSQSVRMVLAGPSRLPIAPIRRIATAGVGLSRPISLLPYRSRQTPISIAPTRLLHSSSSRLNATSTASRSPALPSSEAEAEPGPSSEPEPENQTAGAKLKALMKKYGKYAVVMYLLLSAVDFSLVFVAVHAVGAERIEPVMNSAIQYYRTKRFGEAEAGKLAAEEKEQKQIEKKEEIAKEKAMTKQERKEMSRGWASKSLWAEIALAYAIHKTALLPFRAGLTMAWTPKVVNWLTRRGWIGKGGATRAATLAQGKMRDASEKVKDIARQSRRGKE